MVDKIFKCCRRLLPYKIKRPIASLRYRLFNIFSVVSIETHSACNRRCSYCPNSRFDRGLMENAKKLKTELFHKIIDELAELRWFGQIQYNFYNEPLMDERLPEFIGYARLKLPSSSFAVYTNGDFLTIDLYKRLREAGVTDIIIMEHSERRPNIDELLEFRKSDAFDNVKVLCKKMECVDSRGGLVQFPTRWERPRNCLWPIHNFIVNYEGEAVLCCNDYLNSVKLGNIEGESLMDIWNKPHYKRLRNDLKRGLFVHDMCRKCSWGKFGG